MIVTIGSSSGSLLVYNQNLTLLYSFSPHSSGLRKIKPSPYNKNLVATCSDDNTTKIWNPNLNWSLIRAYLGHTYFVYDVEWINADTLASGGKDRTLQIWSLSTGETQKTFVTNSSVTCLKLLSNGFQLAAGLVGGLINI